MSGNWRGLTRFVQDGEPVSAAVVGRPDRDIDGNVRYLQDLFNAANLGQGLVATSVTVAASVQAGQPVFWNSTTKQFEPALAAVAINPMTGALGIAPSADCVGVCSFKHSATLGDVLLAGREVLDISAAAGANPAPGRYYLSTSTPGGLLQQSPAVSVPVLFLDTSGYVYVQPLVRDFLSTHVHYKFNLVCAPAGTTHPPSVGNPHVISPADPTKAGWLPASDPTFNGNAPAGAAWGYNLAKDPNGLAALWPPVPLSAATLFWDKGQNLNGGTQIPVGLSGLAQIDQFGIWWYSNCYGDVPWPTSYDSTSPPSPLPNHTGPITCPRAEEMRVVLAYAVSLFANNHFAVTSLRAATGSPIVVTDLNGNPATAGDLELALNLGLTVGTTDVAGAEVLKTFSNNGFTKGFVVEALEAGTGIVLSATNVNGALNQGTVTVSVTPTPTDRELAPQVVKLSDANERYYLDTPYVAFPPDRSSAVRVRFAVPPAGLPGSPTLTVRVLLLARVAGTIPTLTMTYRRLPRPGTGLAVNLPDATAEQPLAFTTGQTVTANQYVEVSSAAITVTAGDTILVTLSRAGNDGYTGEVGFLRMGGVLPGS